MMPLHLLISLIKGFLMGMGGTHLFYDLLPGVPSLQRYMIAGGLAVLLVCGLLLIEGRP